MQFATTYSNGSYGAFRKSKMIMDALNVLLAIVIVFLFVALIFLNNQRSLLFPLIFVAGGLDNAVASAKNFMNYNRLAGILLAIVAILLLLLAFISFRVR